MRIIYLIRSSWGQTELYDLANYEFIRKWWIISLDFKLGIKLIWICILPSERKYPVLFNTVQAHNYGLKKCQHCFANIPPTIGPLFLKFESEVRKIELDYQIFFVKNGACITQKRRKCVFVRQTWSCVYTYTDLHK